MSLIVRPQNAASAARLATNVLAGAAGMIAGGAYRKAQNKAVDLVLKGAEKLKDRLINSNDALTTRQTMTAKTRRRKTKSTPSVDLVSQVAPATAYFAGTPRITFGISGRAQTNVEMGDNGVRIIGSDVFPYQIESNGVDGYLPLRASTGGSFLNVVYLDPATVSARLSQFMQMYTFYAFRRLRFWYMPVVGTSTGGAVAMSITSDLYSNQASNSLAKVLQNQHSTITEMWRPVVVDIEHRGTKVYTPYTSNSPPNGDRYQFELDACFSGVLAAAVYGVIFVEYEIDFYSPQFTHSGYTLRSPPAANVNSLGPVNESKVDSRACGKDEAAVSSTVPTLNVVGTHTANGTGDNFVIDPAVSTYEPAINGSGSNSNIAGGHYTLPSNGSGYNTITTTLGRSCTRPPYIASGHK